MSSLNNFHKNLQFTFEEEQEDKIAFLDVLIHKQKNGTFHFSIYRKQTHTDRYLNFNSFHARSHKISVIDSLVTRALKICSGSDLQLELTHIEQVLQENDYPPSIIRKRIELLQSRNGNSNSDDIPRLILPFMGDITYKIVRILKNRLNLQFGYLTGEKMSKLLFNHKERSKDVISGIYSLSCKNCDQCYVGETSRDISIRIKEHLADIRHSRVDTSAVALHIAENPTHLINESCASLIEREPRFWPRKFKEGLYIRDTKHKMNLDDGMAINSIWSAILLPIINRNH